MKTSERFEELAAQFRRDDEIARPVQGSQAGSGELMTEDELERRVDAAIAEYRETVADSRPGWCRR